MEVTVLVFIFMLVGVLLIVSLYAGIIGLAATFTGARYRQCSRCHHHYLTDRTDVSPHECPHSATEHAYQVAYSRLHHAL